MAYEDLLITQPDQGDGFPVSDEWIAQVRDNFEALKPLSDGKTRSSGNITVTSTSYVNVDTALDITVMADPGDVLYIGVSGRWQDEAPRGDLDVFTVVGGFPVNSCSGSTDGASAWIGATNAFTSIGGAIRYVVQPADISAGAVTLRLRVKLGSGGSKVLRANTVNPLHWWVDNRRQA